MIRPSSEMRRGYPIYSSFASKNETSKERRQRVVKQMQALAGSQKWSQSFSTTKLTNNKLYTPHKSKSKKSLGSRCSLSRSKSKSGQRISRLKRNSSYGSCSTPGLSTTKSKPRICQKTLMSKWVKSSSRARLDKVRDLATHSSQRKRSGSLSDNSNVKQSLKKRSSGGTKSRDKQRV